MKVIMLADVKKVGQKGRVVEVKDGYAQNVLIPRRMAIPATPEAMKKAEQAALGAKERAAMDDALAQRILAEIDGKSVTVTAKANEQGGLFKSVGAGDIADAIEKQLNTKIPEDAVLLDEHIKKTGHYPVQISLNGHSATVTVTI